MYRFRRRITSLYAYQKLQQRELEESHEEIAALERAWRIDPSELKIKKLVAEGAYGAVYQVSPHSFATR